MKRIILITIILLSSVAFLFAQDEEFRTIENKAFTVGEKLTFDVNFGFITAGVAEMAIPKMKRISRRDVYNVTFRVNSVASFDPFFKVRDRYETYLDKEGLFPWRFEQHIREGGYSKDFSAFFDQRRHIAKTTEGSYEIPPYVNDIVSAFYLTRTFDFKGIEPGHRFELYNFFDDKVHPLEVLYHGKEKVSVGAGTFNCIVIEPLVVEGGLFKSEGNILVWLSDDELKIPVKVQTKVVIGSINAELTDYEGLAGELTSKVD